MKTKNLFLLALALVPLAACSEKTLIDGVLADAPDSDVIVKYLNVNHYEVLDTIRTDAFGRYAYRLDIEKGEPEFIYLYHGDTRIASLLLERGDRVEVTSDTLGSCSVTGSPESEKLLGIERDEAEFYNHFSATSARLADMNPSAPEAALVRRDLAKQYVDYYRSRVRYIMENPYSLTVIPVLYQNAGGEIPVFTQPTDALHFTHAADSLKTVYPESRYVKALADEAARRRNVMELDMRVSAADQVGFPDLEMTDTSGRPVRLSEVQSKVTLLYFWTVEAMQNLFNGDVMKPLYEQYHDKGFEIYAVSLDVDKAAWAAVVRNQQLPWINVCDGRGKASKAAMLYHVTDVPAVFVLQDGALVTDAVVRDEASLRKFLAARLK